MFTQSPVAQATGTAAPLSEVRHRLDDSFERAVKVESDGGFQELGAAVAEIKAKFTAMQMQISALQPSELINPNTVSGGVLDPKYVARRIGGSIVVRIRTAVVDTKGC